MVRVIVVLVSLALACYPAQAVAPAVLIAKEIVKQITFLAMIDAGMLGMPEDMRSAFRKQLAS